MYEWQEQIQITIDEIDRCIKQHNDEALTLPALSSRLGYSEFYYCGSSFYFKILLISRLISSGVFRGFSKDQRTVAFQNPASLIAKAYLYSS